MKDDLKIFKRGLITGLFLQLAIGPVFFFVINLTLQRSIYDGLAGVLAVTLVDYFYVVLSVVGIGKMLKEKRIKNAFEIIGPVILIIFGGLMLGGGANDGFLNFSNNNSTSLFLSFVSVFILTISSPVTIIFFTGLFTAKASEYNYTQRDLYVFGAAVGFATLMFMSLSVILFSLIGSFVPIALIRVLNIFVGLVLIFYGLTRVVKFL